MSVDDEEGAEEPYEDEERVQLVYSAWQCQHGEEQSRWGVRTVCGRSRELKGMPAVRQSPSPMDERLLERDFRYQEEWRQR